MNKIIIKLNWILLLSCISFLLISLLSLKSFLEWPRLMSNNFFDDIINRIRPHEDLMLTIAAITGTIIAISIPISIEIISRGKDKYMDNEVSEMLTKNWTYKFQYLNTALIAIFLGVAFLGVKNKILLAIVTVCFIWVLITFYRWIKLVLQFSTNFKYLYIEQKKKDAETIVPNN